MSIRPQKPAPATPAPGKLPITELPEMKARRQPIVMVTAYDAPGGRLADEAGADLVLVGDSAAMTVLGHDSTVPATMDEMMILTRAVTRGASRPLVIADMPFGSFQVSDEDALRNAIRFVKEAGADAVKLEGAGTMLSRVRAIVDAGIPVMGHLGLTPQSATMLGGYKAQGRSAEKALRLYDDARALEAAGCFSLVLEAVPAPVAARITRDLVDSHDRDRRGSRLRRSGARVARPPRPLPRPRRPLRQALRRDRRHDPGGARGVRGRRAGAPLPRGAAHVRDARRGARAVRGRGLRSSRTRRGSRLEARRRRARRRVTAASSSRAPSARR